MEQKINVLGTEYTIYLQSEDARLAECDGFCDKTSKEIHIGKFPDDCELAQPEVYEKKILRHELVHAFMFESGLAELCNVTVEDIFEYEEDNGEDNNGFNSIQN